MKKTGVLLIPIVLLSLACNSSVGKIFAGKTPHEAYGKEIEDRPAGKLWLAAAKTALVSTVPVKTPYVHSGYFPADKPRAIALEFSAKKGERIQVQLDRRKKDDPVLYADLFEKDGHGLSHLAAIDTSESHFGFNAEEAGTYVLRLQTELDRPLEYRLSIKKGPSLGFPVLGKKAKTGSFWGDPRDGGKRSHEGIDIFAPRRTPVIAAADGIITKLGEGGIGGRTVWQRAAGRNLYFYYAHLDKQLVEAGQEVQKGDTIGLVGNTGNARYTPSHLHFGIYTAKGPVDPYPFVKKETGDERHPPKKDLRTLLQFKSGDKKLSSPGGLLVPLAVNQNGYLVETPDGVLRLASFNSVSTANVEKEKSVATESKQAAARG